MFFSQTSRKPVDSRVPATWRALSSHYHASSPSWSSSAVRKVQLPSTVASVSACPLFHYSLSTLSERATALTLVSCTSSFADPRYRTALNTELRAPASLPHALEVPKHSAITSIANPFCSTPEKHRFPESDTYLSLHIRRTNPCSVARVFRTSNNTRIMPMNGMSPAATMIGSNE